MVLGCSDLTEGAGGVVGLEINTPPKTEIEVGETMALTARALDKDGNTIPAAVTWRAPDATLTSIRPPASSPAFRPAPAGCRPCRPPGVQHSDLHRRGAGPTP